MKSLLFIMLFAAVSCGLSEIDGPSRNDGGGVWTGPGFNAGVGDDDKSVCYITAMDFRKGYDWRADEEKGSVKCSLVVFADGVPVMKIPVGDEYEISSDPDMHRLIDGHVYTDYSTETETVVRKNGRELFRYGGRETICGMLADSSGVFTLGAPRSGKGFCFRKNGEVILGRDSGRTFGRLHTDGNDVCFAFCEPVISARDTVERYYHVRNGHISQEALREDVKKVWDMVSHNGRICYVAEVIGVRTPVLVVDGKMEILDLPADASMKTCRLSMSHSNLFIEGICACPDKPLTSVLWVHPFECHLFPGGMTVASMSAADGSACCVLNPVLPDGMGIIYRNGESYGVSPGYAAIGNSSSAMVGGILHVGLSSKSGKKPVVWKDGIIDTLNVNGFISSVVAGK